MNVLNVIEREHSFGVHLLGGDAQSGREALSKWFMETTTRKGGNSCKSLLRTHHYFFHGLPVLISGYKTRLGYEYVHGCTLQTFFFPEGVKLLVFFFSSSLNAGVDLTWPLTRARTKTSLVSNTRK